MFVKLGQRLLLNSERIADVYNLGQVSAVNTKCVVKIELLNQRVFDIAFSTKEACDKFYWDFVNDLSHDTLREYYELENSVGTDATNVMTSIKVRY